MCRANIITRFIAILCILTITLLAGCQKTDEGPNNTGYFGTESSSSPKIKGEISLFSTQVDTLNPMLTKNYYTNSFLQLIYEGLTKFNEKNEIEPVLAESWISTNLNKEWKFSLKKEVDFHNKRNLTPNDVIQTINYLRTIDSSYRELIKNISNVESIDKTTVKFSLKESDPEFQYKTTFPILNASSLKNKSSLSTKPIGTGPYVFDSIKNGVYYLKRNSIWHLGQTLKNKYGVQPPFIKTVKVKIIKSEKLAIGAFLRNELDIMPISDISSVQSVKTGYNTHELITNQQEMLIFNTNHYVLKSEIVRQAMAMFINRTTIINKTVKDKGVPSELPLFPASLAPIHFKNNPLEAERILKEDSWVKATYNRWFKTGVGSLNFELLVNIESKERCKIADALADRYGELGIVITVKKLAYTEVMSAIKEGRYQLALVGINAPAGSDLSYFYGTQEKIGKFNYTGYSSTQFDYLIKSYKEENNPTERIELFKQIKDVIYRDVPALGLFNYETIVLSNRTITGYLRPNFRSPYNTLSECFVTF